MNKKCYKIVGYCMKTLKVVDYDDTVFDNLKCGTRVLLLGAEPKIIQILSLYSNYTQTNMNCNFEEG